jgi:hypothetical protein
VTLAPFTGPLLGASGERATAAPAYAGRYGSAFAYWVLDLQRYALFGFPDPGRSRDSLDRWAVQAGLVVIVPCLLASILCWWIPRMRWARPWFALWLVWTAIGILTSASASGPATTLAALWYGNPARLASMVLPINAVLTVAGACVIGLGVRQLVRLVSGADPAPAASPAAARPGRSLGAAGLASAIVVTVLLGLGLTHSARGPLQHALVNQSPKGPAYPRVFAWLAGHITNGDVAAYARHDEFMTWSYADNGVPLLFGIPPLTATERPNYDDRLHAWAWLTNGAKSTPQGCLVQKFGIEYVVVGRQRVPGWPFRYYNPARLAVSPNVTLVHQDGPLKVYQVNDAGKACPPGVSPGVA